MREMALLKRSPLSSKYARSRILTKKHCARWRANDPAKVTGEVAPEDGHRSHAYPQIPLGEEEKDFGFLPAQPEWGYEMNVDSRKDFLNWEPCLVGVGLTHLQNHRRPLDIVDRRNSHSGELEGKIVEEGHQGLPGDIVKREDITYPSVKPQVFGHLQVSKDVRGRPSSEPVRFGVEVVAAEDGQACIHGGLDIFSVDPFGLGDKSFDEIERELDESSSPCHFPTKLRQPLEDPLTLNERTPTSLRMRRATS